jgi:hypothetical protein
MCAKGKIGHGRYNSFMQIELYHGSSHKIEGALQPVLRSGSSDYIHTKPAVFATARKDIASLFMFPFEGSIASISFENDIAYICTWGTPEEFAPKDHGGFLYILPATKFEKVGKEYEWQAFEPIAPIAIKEFSSAITGMIECGAQVYFINDEKIFDRIVADKDHRTPILAKLIPENQKRGENIKKFGVI